MQLVFGDFSDRRKMLLLSSLEEEYKALDNPVTLELFGDDLEKQIKEITDASQVSKKITKRFSFNRPKLVLYNRIALTYIIWIQMLVSLFTKQTNLDLIVCIINFQIKVQCCSNTSHSQCNVHVVIHTSC